MARAAARGDTAPPDDVLPSTTKISHVGMIAQRPIRVAISEATAVAVEHLQRDHSPPVEKRDR